ncbi:AAA family ATPase [bacterium]|nr:AAA family ATPase [bacterium]
MDAALSVHRQAPHDLVAEAATLGSLLLDNSVFDIVSGTVSKEDFYSRHHAAMFEAIAALIEKSAPVDPVTLADHCQSEGTLETIGGQAGLIAALEAVPSAARAGYYADIVARCATRRRVITAAATLTRLMQDPAATTEAVALAQQQLADAAEGSAPRKRRAIVTRLDTVEAKPLEWLWPGRFPLGKLSLLVGDPGRGKSLLTLDMAARITTGRPWPDEPGDSIPIGNVVLLSAEDDAADTIRPRLEALGGDVARVAQVNAMEDPEAPEGRALSLATDLPPLEDAIEETGGVRLVIIDPLSAYLGGTDSHKNAEVRGILAPLAAIAERTGAAIVGVTHLNKNTGNDMIYRAMGSLGFVAAARSVWAVVPDKETPRRIIFTPLKSNLAGQTDALAYTVIPHPENWDVPVIDWEEDPVPPATVQTLFNGPTHASDASDTTQKASEWLTEVLADGPLPVQQVRDMSRDEGIGYNALVRARQKLGVTSRPSSRRGAWELALPGASPALFADEEEAVVPF